MLMMSIPKTFQWSNTSTEKLNKMSFIEKKMFLRKEKLNIRHCIGEAVPTGVFDNIAKKIKDVLNQKLLSTTEIKNIIKQEKLNDTESLISFIKTEYKNLGLENIFQIAEYANSNRQENAAFLHAKTLLILL